MFQQAREQDGRDKAGDVVLSGTPRYVELHEIVVRPVMTRSIADISWDELDGIARAAGTAAAEETVKAGVSTFGVMYGRAVQVAPDGQVLDLGPIEEFGDAFAAPEDLTVPKSEARPAGRTPAGKPISRFTA